MRLSPQHTGSTLELLDKGQQQVPYRYIEAEVFSISFEDINVATGSTHFIYVRDIFFFVFLSFSSLAFSPCWASCFFLPFSFSSQRWLAVLQVGEKFGLERVREKRRDGQTWRKGTTLL